MRPFLKKTALAMIAIAASWPVALSEQHLELSGGHKTLRCTYLSPLTYTGPGYGLGYEWRLRAWNEGRTGMQARADIDYGYLLSPAKNSRMYDLSLNLQWGVEQYFSPLEGLTLAGGATAGINGGAIYLVRNGNNPVQALFWTGLSLTLRGEYDRIRLLGKKLTISENVEIPTMGAFFCPQYGETYYEIYVGNHSGLAHFGWWGNRPQVKSRLIADWQLGKYALSLGFEYRYQGLECNDITTRQAVCSGIIGIRF